MQRRQCGKNGKLEKNPGMAADASQKQKKEVMDEARNKGRKVHFASLMDLCHLKNLGGTTISEMQRSSCTSR